MADARLFAAGAAGLFSWLNNPAMMTFAFDHGIRAGEKLGLKFIGGDGAGKTSQVVPEIINARTIRIATQGIGGGGGFSYIPNGFLRFVQLQTEVILDPVTLPANFGFSYPYLGLLPDFDIPDYVEPPPVQSAIDPLNKLFKMNEDNFTGLSSGFGSNQNGVTTDAEQEDCNCGERKKALWWLLVALAVWWIWKKWR